MNKFDLHFLDFVSDLVTGWFGAQNLLQNHISRKGLCCLVSLWWCLNSIHIVRRREGIAQKTCIISKCYSSCVLKLCGGPKSV